MQSSTRRPLTPAASISITRPGFVAIGRGQPVLLLHATMSSKSQWRSLAERLAARFLVVAADLHGYGDNPALPERTDFTVDDDRGQSHDSKFDCVIEAVEDICFTPFNVLYRLLCRRAEFGLPVHTC